MPRRPLELGRLWQLLIISVLLVLILPVNNRMLENTTETALQNIQDLNPTLTNMLSQDENIVSYSNWSYGPSFEVAVSNNIAYVGSGVNLILVDISNPDNFFQISSVWTPSYVHGIYVDENYVFVVSKDYGLSIIDVTNIFSPRLIASLEVDGGAEGVHVEGNLAYLANYEDGLSVINLTDITSPV